MWLPQGERSEGGSSWDQTQEVLLPLPRRVMAVAWLGLGPGSGVETDAWVQGIMWSSSPPFC